jgi:hypothetical protein
MSFTLPIDEGADHIIYLTPQGVEKIQKRHSKTHDTVTERRIHSLVSRLIDQNRFERLRVPSLSENTDRYEMARIQTDQPIYLGDRNHSYSITDEHYEMLCDEVTRLWTLLWNNGFAAYDFELFLQPSLLTIITDFDKFGFRMTTGPRSVMLPHQTDSLRNERPYPDLRFFFESPCFPRDFVARLRKLGFEPPADLLPSSKTNLE